MSVQRCPSCSEPVPKIAICPDCGKANPDIPIPDRTDNAEELTRHLSSIAGGALDDTISFDDLRSDYGKYNRPLGDYLFKHEQPVELVESPKVVIEDEQDNTWKIKAGFRKSGHLVLTDNRVFVLLPTGGSDESFIGDSGSTTSDQVIPVEHDNIVTVSHQTGLRKNRAVLETVNGVTYKIGVSGSSETELTEVTETVRTFSETNQTPSSRSEKIIREVDKAVAEQETAEALIQEVADIFADHDEKTEFDSAVAESTSLGELFVALQSQHSRGVETDEGADAQSAIVPRGTSLRERLSHTFRDADPADVGKYTIAAGLGFGTFAITAPFSTAAGLAAIAAGGAATGAYASANPDSSVAQIDPITLATRARMQGNQWDNSSVPGGSGVGTVLGAMEYLAEEEVPPEYAHWVANADIEKIQRGAELGARAADRRDDIDSAALSSMAGGGFGLAYGYMDDSDQLDEVKEMFDDELNVSRELSEENAE